MSGSCECPANYVELGNAAAAAMNRQKPRSFYLERRWRQQKVQRAPGQAAGDLILANASSATTRAMAWLTMGLG